MEIEDLKEWIGEAFSILGNMITGLERKIENLDTEVRRFRNDIPDISTEDLQAGFDEIARLILSQHDTVGPEED
jgi:hypothetical protein